LESGKKLLAIDIGSTKVCAIIAEVRGESVRLIGAGVEKSQGLKKGSITNIELASRSIKSAFEYAKRVAGTFDTEAVVSISGALTRGLDSHGIVNVPNGEITIQEIKRVMQTAQYNAQVPSDYDILHVLPYNFKVDEQDYVEDPLGMNASRLEAFVHIIITPKSNFNNLKKAVEGANLQVSKIVLDSYASYISTINGDEKTLGAAVVDLGGDTSSFVIHASGNSIRYAGFLSVGSTNVTNDLSMALHTPVHIAENVKTTYGNLNFFSDDLIELPVIGDENSTHEVSLDIVGQVIHARVAETLDLVAKQINDSGLRQDIGAGFVLTGGLTKLEGVRELAMNVLDAPVRLAKPKDVGGLFNDLRDPSFSSTIGLIIYSTGGHSLYEFDSNGTMLYNEDSVEQHRASSREISLDNIGPNSFGNSGRPTMPPPPAQPQQMIGDFGSQQSSQHSQPYQQQRHPQQQQHNNSRDFGRATPQQRDLSMDQPIRDELPKNNYYQDINRLRDSGSNRNKNQNSQVSKLWQWVTQLF
jgi:cell division protein FtsA